MLVDFATTLHIQDRRSGAPASLVDIAETVGEWAEIPEPAAFLEPVELLGIGSRGAHVTTEKLDLGAGDAWAWTMRLAHADGRDATVRWVVEVEAIEDPAIDTTSVAISLGRESTDRRVRLLRTDSPAPPAIIRDLVNSRTLDCLDGPIPLTAEESVLGRGGVDGFVRATLFEPKRHLPIVGITRRPTATAMLVSPARLARRLAGMAHVWEIPPESTWALSTHLPEGLGVYNGAVRLWWPGLNADSDRFDHQLWLPREDRLGVEDEIVALVAQSARSRFSPPPAIQQLRTLLRDQDRARLLSRIDSLQGRRTDQPHTLSAADHTDLVALRQEVQQVQRNADEWFAFAEQAERMQLEAEEKLAQAQMQYRELRYENNELKRRLRSATGGADTGAESSAEAAFIDEVRAEWEQRLTAQDRAVWPLLDVRIHHEFLQSLDRLIQGGGIAREKVIQVCAEVACDRAKELNGRQVHPLRVGRGPESGQRVRASDGAKAYRCALQRDTPQARRLHWWRVPGVDAIEFAHVGVHDDETCAE